MATTSTIQTTYFGAGTFASRPATLNLATGCFGFWWATDTKILYVYDLITASWTIA